MKGKKKQQPLLADVPILSHKDYPVYYKNGTRFTCVMSDSKFLQVKLMKTSTVISRGDQLTLVQEVQQDDTTTDKVSFMAAYNEALERARMH